eukprot:PhF_6_TR10948/c0_g2_i1/m.17668
MALRLGLSMSALLVAALAKTTQVPVGAVNDQAAIGPSTAKPALSPEVASAFIVICAALGFAFAMYWWYVASEIEIRPDKGRLNRNSVLSSETMERICNISKLVSDGATTFLVSE